MNEESDDWIYDIIPEDQIDAIKESFRNIRDNETTQINLVLSAPRSSAIDLCKTFEKSMKGHLASSVIIIKFMANIIDMIEEELHADGIDPYQD